MALKVSHPPDVLFRLLPCLFLEEIVLHAFNVLAALQALGPRRVQPPLAFDRSRGSQCRRRRCGGGRVVGVRESERFSMFIPPTFALTSLTQVRSFATGTSCVTDVALASTGALVSRAAVIPIPSSTHATSSGETARQRLERPWQQGPGHCR